MDSLRRMLPSPNAIFVFEAAARHRNFTRAARELNVTQPAVSRALGELEDHLGTRLFLRSREGVRLTEDGDALFRAVSQGFAGIRQELISIESRRSGSATVTLSVSTAFTTHWLMPRIDSFQRAFPTVDLRFQLVPGPLGGRYDDVDLAMRFVEPGEPAPRGRHVMPEAYLPVCAPGYREVLARGAEHVTCIRLSDRRGDWTRDFPEFEPVGRKGRSLSVADYSVVVQTVLVGKGVAAGWLNVVSYWLREGALIPACHGVACPGRQCWIVHPESRTIGAVVAEIRDWIIGELRADISALVREHPGLGLSELLKGNGA